ncbi:MAG: membrane protein insertase YidC [Alphaproteobacteria bacterium]|nr:membrane protein insertase YidC [Alphaproteobacteria bacterium]
MGSDNDRRVLLAIVLSLGVYYLWVAFFAPPPPPAVAPEDPTTVAEAPADPPSDATPSIGTAPDVPARVVETVPERSESFGSQVWGGQVTSSEGVIRDITLHTVTAEPEVTTLWSWVAAKVKGEADGGWSPYVGGDAEKRLLTSSGAFGLAGAGALGGDGGYSLTRDGQAWVAKRTLPSGLSIEKRFAPGADPHTLAVSVTFRNGTGAAVDRLWIGVVDEMSGDAGRFVNAARPQAVVDGDMEHLMNLKDLAGEDDERFDGPVQWVGVGDRYFMNVLALSEPVPGEVVFDTMADGRSGAFFIDAASLPAGESRTYELTGFIGPKELGLLQSVGFGLEDSVEFGIFGFFSKVLLFLLKLFQKALVNWGLSIIGLTVLVKVIFFPLTQKAFVSSKKMSALQPMMKEMQEKYKDNKELQSVETMKLFKEHGVNPMGGCLPTFIQMPVWFALYGVMLNSVELYDSSFLYLKDLTAPDPYGVLPLAYVVLMVAQQRMMPTGNMDPTQQKVMKMIPLVFGFMMFGFPSGLVLYFSVNILLTIFQQWLINKTYKGPTPAAGAAT